MDTTVSHFDDVGILQKKLVPFFTINRSGPGLERLMEDPRESGAAAGLSATPIPTE